MYVIAEIQGQQFKVEEGKKLYVHHIQNVEANATVEIEKVLLVDNDGVVTVGTPTVLRLLTEALQKVNNLTERNLMSDRRSAVATIGLQYGVDTVKFAVVLLAFECYDHLINQVINV